MVSERRLSHLAVSQWLLVALVLSVTFSRASALTIEERVECQRAVERVYWEHRSWPQDNPGPKPAFESAVSDEMLREQVTAYLRGSAEIEAERGGSCISGSELQAEIDRTARETGQPDVLRELWRALGDDPYLVAECLVRPLLVERLTPASVSSPAGEMAWEASAGIHEPAAPGFYHLPPIVPDPAAPLAPAGTVQARFGHTAVWTGAEMIVWGGEYYKDPDYAYLSSGGRYYPSTNSWKTTGATDAPSGRLFHTAVWTGSEMIVWGGYDGSADIQTNTGGRYNPATNSWRSTSTANSPQARWGCTAVWTGKAMIVWGGRRQTGSTYEYLNTGGRYDPASSTWSPVSATGAPEKRAGHSAVWSGERMIVWGGYGLAGGLLKIYNSGSRYDPATNRWSKTSTIGAPAARRYHSAVWTGTEMIVWGGSNYESSGGRYNPETNLWGTVTAQGAPTSRLGHAGLWTGDRMVVWGGYRPGSGSSIVYLKTGGRYDADADRWTSTVSGSAPQGRVEFGAIWTGTEVVIWGGRYFTSSGSIVTLGDGKRYNPTTNKWNGVR